MAHPITISFPDRLSLTVEVEWIPRPGDMFIIEHGYYRVMEVTHRFELKDGLTTRIRVVDLSDVKDWRDYATVLIFYAVVIGAAVLAVTCLA